MNLRKAVFFAIRALLATIYLWVVADRLGLLGPAGNPGVVWGNFATFLDYTAALNPWFPRALSDILGYVATLTEIALAVLFLSGIRLKEAALVSLAMLVVFILSMTFALGLAQAYGFILFTMVVAAASAYVYREAKRTADARAEAIRQ